MLAAVGVLLLEVVEDVDQVVILFVPVLHRVLDRVGRFVLQHFVNLSVLKFEPIGVELEIVEEKLRVVRFLRCRVRLEEGRVGLLNLGMWRRSRARIWLSGPAGSSEKMLSTRNTFWITEFSGWENANKVW